MEIRIPDTTLNKRYRPETLDASVSTIKLTE